MKKPYIITELTANIPLYPDQMDNKLYIHLKNNLKDKLLGRCYKDYGYIDKIYKILSYTDGLIEAENFTGTAIFEVKFSCKLYSPPKGMQIICKIDRISKALIIVINGPIYAIIPNDRINNKNFFTDTSNKIRYKKDNKSYVLGPKEYIKVTINNSSFVHNSNKIKAMCFLDEMATEEEINQIFMDDYEEESNYGELANV